MFWEVFLMIKPGGAQTLRSESCTVRFEINGMHVCCGCHTGFLYGKDSHYLNQVLNTLLRMSGVGGPKTDMHARACVCVLCVSPCLHEYMSATCSTFTKP
jgi:hypothetical protein